MSDSRTDRLLRIGVLGTARIARRLVAEMQATEGVRVTAIASRQLSRATWYAQQYGIPQGLGSYEALLESPDVDAVYVPLPPSLHLPWTIAAAKAGKHVLCEKPLTTSVHEAEALDQACQASNVVWLDATAWLHHERTVAMRERIAGGIGTLRHVSVAVSFFEPFQSGDHRLEADLGGGCWLDLGWYGASFCLWATGERPRVVAATASLRNGVPFRGTALLAWDSGVTGTLNCAYDTASRKWFEVAGDQASLVCDDFTRPWPERPVRYFLHERTGQGSKHEFSGNQEQRMIALFRAGALGETDLRPWQHRALETQRLVEDLIATSNASTMRR